MVAVVLLGDSAVGVVMVVVVDTGIDVVVEVVVLVVARS